ncbi:XdhC family protein [soil metagenome]
MAELRAEGAAFAIAVVTWRRGPSSGRPGAKAIVHPDGTVEGWLGGACATERGGRGLVESGGRQPRLLVLGEHDHRAEVTNIAMACSSEGAMEVFVEPQLPTPDLHLIGSSPMVEALGRLARALDWRVTIVDDVSLGKISPDSFVVVATQGHYDEPALEAALATPARYVGLVASHKRASSVMDWLRERGVSDDQLARVHTPAGLDLGSIEHAEMAVAILAEIVSIKGMRHTQVEVAKLEEAIDPVCGMTVDVATARFSSEHGGKTYYFCAHGCKTDFDDDPESFLAS